jgi:integrase
MRGSVTKYAIKGSSRPRWRFRVYTGKDQNGQKLYEGLGGFEKQSEAQSAMAQRISEIAARGTPVPAKAKLLGAWVQEWLDTYAVNRCQPKTLERYRQLAAYITGATEGPALALATTALPELSHNQLEAAFFGLLNAESKRKKHLSARTVRHIASVINAALNKAFRLELLPINPMLRVDLPTAQRKEAHSLSQDQIQAIRKVCQGDWTFALVEIALATAARRGELLALQWADLDWVTGTVTISKSLEQTQAGLRIKRPKSNKTRSCQLPKSGIIALQFLRERQGEHRRLFAGDYRNQDLIFCQPNGEYLEPDLVSQVIVRRMRSAGIKDGSLHTLRHTHASHLLSGGLSLSAVSARLGHSDTNVTARVYAHALPADDQRAADLWDSVIGKPVN